MPRSSHLTAPHILPPGRLLYGIDPAERLSAAIVDINTRFHNAAFLIITGDLAHRGEPAACGLLNEILSGLKIPVHLGIGNHDGRTAFHREFPDTPTDAAGFVQYRFTQSGSGFVMLDSVEDGRSSGFLCPDRLSWAEKTLYSVGGTPALVFLHHSPVALGIPDLDDIGLRNASDLGKVVENSGNVKHFVFGHVHRPAIGVWQGIPFSTQRSLVNQSALNFHRDGGVLDNLEPPTYSVVELQDSGDIVIHLHEFMDPSPTFYISGLHAIDEARNPSDVDGTFTQL